MPVSVYTCCPVMWPAAKGLCRYYGAPMPHGCHLRPGHVEVDHRCGCGNVHRPSEQEFSAADMAALESELDALEETDLDVARAAASYADAVGAILERFNAVEMQAIRKALQAAETVIAHADDPARQQTKIEYLSWALVDLSDAVQAWVLEDEQ